MWLELNRYVAVHMHLIDYKRSFPAGVQLAEVEESFHDLLANLVIIVVSLGVDALDILVDTKLTNGVDSVKIECNRMIGDHISMKC